jgi:glycosyltransferase involved in cell wall biosynthesis
MYNKGDLVGRSIRSILAQTFTDFDLIVVDDGSTDNSVEIVNSFKDQRITLIGQDNAGPGGARNTGIQAAQTEYVAFLDADDEWYPWFLENSLKAIKEYDVPLVASMFYRLPDGTDMTTLVAKNGVHPGKYSLTETMLPAKASAIIGTMHPLNTLIKTETLKKYGGFYDKNHCTFGEDQTLFMRICINEDIVIIGPASSRYHCEDSEHGLPNIKRPLQPYLANPDEVLACCPAEKKQLLTAVLELRAIRTACHKLQRGERQSAAKLIKKFPGAAQHTKQYHKLMRKFGLGPIYPIYLVFKNNFIKPAKAFLQSFGAKDNEPLPLMPYEQGYNDRQ